MTEAASGRLRKACCASGLLGAGFAFAGIIYFVFCFSMSRYSLFVERRLNAHRRN